MGDLTDDFSLSEFLDSEKAVELGIENTPLPEHEANIRDVLAPFCQRVRNRAGCAIAISSGYRNPDVNAAVGGVSNSDHALGYAADITAASLTAKELAQMIANDKVLMADVDQLILETSRAVVHVSVNPRNRRQIMTQKHGPGTPFDHGIV